jgi:hypothetical protein
MYVISFLFVKMTSLSFTDIFLNAMHFNDDQGLLQKTCDLFYEKFYNNRIRYFIVGGYALTQIKKYGPVSTEKHWKSMETWKQYSGRKISDFFPGSFG